MSAPTPPPPAPAPAPAATGFMATANPRLAKELELLHQLRKQFPTAVLGDRIFRDQLFIDIAPESIRNVVKFLRDDPAMEFRTLTDLTCVDYLKLPDYARSRFGVTYILFSFKLDARLRLKAWVSQASPELPSVADIFGSANWAEREVFDLYGIRFSGHPGLKRILMPADFDGHPLRKDYPLKGRGERDSFPVLSRRES